MRTLKLSKKNLFFKRFVFIAVIFLTLYGAVKNYITHYKIFHSLPIEMGDGEITELLNQRNISSILWCAVFIALTVLVCGIIIDDVIKDRKKAKDSADRRIKGGAVIAIVAEIFVLIMMALFLFYLCRGLILRISSTVENQISTEDWEISVQTVEKKDSRQSGKSRDYYVILRESGRKHTVRRAQYAIFINENENVYLVEDKQHGIYMILSPKQYRYVGEKLDTTRELIYTPIMNTYGARYYLRFAIIFTVAFIIEILILWKKHGSR